MLQIVQLQDGNFKVVIDYHTDGHAIHLEWIFAETESDAEPLEGGLKINLELK